MASSGSCGSCNSCQQDVQRIKNAINNVSWTNFFGPGTCQRWIFEFGEKLGNPNPNCFKAEIVFWDTNWPGGFPFIGHTAMKFTACNGEVFYVDKGLGRADHIFGPGEIPPSYVIPSYVPPVTPWGW